MKFFNWPPSLSILNLNQQTALLWLSSSSLQDSLCYHAVQWKLYSWLQVWRSRQHKFTYLSYKVIIKVLFVVKKFLWLCLLITFLNFQLFCTGPLILILLILRGIFPPNLQKKKNRVTLLVDNIFELSTILY